MSNAVVFTKQVDRKSTSRTCALSGDSWMPPALRTSRCPDAFLWAVMPILLGADTEDARANRN